MDAHKTDRRAIWRHPSLASAVASNLASDVRTTDAPACRRALKGREKTGQKGLTGGGHYGRDRTFFRPADTTGDAGCDGIGWV